MPSCPRPLAALAVAMALIACPAACVSAEAPRAAPPPLPPTAFAEDEAVFGPEALRADFAALYDGLQAAHYDLFAHRPKAEYDALFAAMTDGLGRPMTRTEAMVVFQRFAAYGNVAHARVDFPMAAWRRFREAGGKAFPAELVIRDGRLFVARGFADMSAFSPGTEILAIEGKPASEWLERITRNVSADTPYLAQTQSELLFRGLFWLEAGERERFALVLRAPDGRRSRVSVAATSLADEEKAAAAAGEGPFRLSQARQAEILDGGIAYLRPGPFYAAETPENPWNPKAFLGFLDDAFARFAKAEARALIVDLRQNPGGNNSFSDPLIARFADAPFRFASSFRIRSSEQARRSNAARIEADPASAEGVSGLFAARFAAVPYGETFPFEIEMAKPAQKGRFEGPVFVLIDRYSYSNAVSIAAIVKDYGFGTVIGEATSDMATTYGAMERFALPVTGIEVGFPKALIVRPSGDARVAGVTPDVEIEGPAFATEDVMLTRAAASLRQSLEKGF